MLLSLSLVLIHISVCVAQNIYRNPKNKNPFQPPVFDDGDQWSPSDADVKEALTTVEPSGVPAFQGKEKVHPGSPFSPPVKSEWYKTDEEAEEPKSSAWLSSLEARQLYNTQLIPALSNIDLNKEHHKNLVEYNNKYEDSHRPKFRSKRPKISVYQHRDMHDTAPGVTPWTRYTEKPKISEDNGWSSGKTYAQCGYQSYSPRNQICCQGQIVRRQGIQPSCCGSQAFDNVFSKCCNGVVSLKATQDPKC